MKILIDSREQMPLFFDNYYVEGTEVIALPIGDYSCEYKQGFQCPIVFERKTLDDLFLTMSQNYERFRREIEKAKELDIKVIIVIEATFGEILWGSQYSIRDGLSVVRQLFTLWIKYDVPFYCFKNRSEMSTFIIEFFVAIGKQALRDLKEQKKGKAPT